MEEEQLSEPADEARAEELRKKIKTRAGHRGSVTRLLRQLEEHLESADTPMLKQMKVSLMRKSDTLTKLDGEILELVREDQLETEIERADLITEEVTLAVIRLEEALKERTAPTILPTIEVVHTPRRDREDSPPASLERRRDHEDSPPATLESEVGERRLTTTGDSSGGLDSRATTVAITAEPPHVTGTLTTVAPTVSASAVSGLSTTTTVTVTSGTLPIPTPPHVTVMSSGPPGVMTPLGASSTLTVSSSGALPLSCVNPFGTDALAYSVPSGPTYSMPLPYSTLMPTPSGTPVFSSLNPVMSGPPFGTHPPPTGMYPSVTPVPGMHDTSGATPLHNPSHIVPRVKLPKLSIKKFNGDLTKWVTFWDAFNSSIHANPTLTSVDKFNYLVSFLESSAAEAIAGLSLTAANYTEAVSILRKRFGNSQLIVNRHMEALLAITTVSSHHDVRGLRKLYDAVESHVRCLRSLGVSADSYGGLLTSVLVNKLPSEIKLVISRVMTEERWELDRLMKVLEEEVNVRERAGANQDTSNRRKPPFRSSASALVAGSSGANSAGITCTYCGKGHTSATCGTVTDVSARKEVLRKEGRCYVCLRKNHVVRECRSTLSCKKCRGRHHVSICSRNSSQGRRPSQQPPPNPPAETPTSHETPTDHGQSTIATYAGSLNSVLLQTARLHLFNPSSETLSATARAILDTGSQRTYITRRIRDVLKLPAVRTESVRISTFGSSESRDASCDVVQLALVTRNDGMMEMTALVVPCICSSLTAQPTCFYDHLSGLDLADGASEDSDVLDIDVLIGSDLYWELVTGNIVRGESGPTAIQTKVGWVLSGPTDQQDVAVNLTLASTHTLKVDTLSAEPSLDDRLKQFWELESLGVMENETSVYDKFVQQIRFDGQRYEVSLPWKEHHPPLRNHLDLCSRRLSSLLRRLRENSQLLYEYDAIIQEQVKKGIVEVVHQPMQSVSDRTHYLPHHGVVRQDKATSKLRIVYDASARSSGPSLNDCLYTGPKFGQSIFDILLRFRSQRVALIGDIEKAFLMVSVHEQDRDSLRFLWAVDPSAEVPELITLRFTRVVFGVSASPFLLNATITHHLKSYYDADPEFVDKFLSSIYVDDLVSGAGSDESAYEFYSKSKLRLAEAGFKLRKFATNSNRLRMLVCENELMSDDLRAGEGSRDDVGGVQGPSETHEEEDQSYAKTSLGSTEDEKPGIHMVLGVEWNIGEDSFLLDIGGVAHAMEDMEPTKRSVVSITAKFFDPFGVLSPVTILFKMFCQHLCEAKVGWDEPLTEALLQKWDRLLVMLRDAKPLQIPRCLYSVGIQLRAAKLIGFCDASAKAYAAVVYMRLEGDTEIEIKFLAAKTRVAPVGGTTIPRMELLSALLLSKLISSVREALSSEFSLGDPVCFTDSKAALFWIRGTHHEWKQFVENRVITIRGLVGPECWKHCPGRENPADIPSRGMSASALAKTPLWLDGPVWLCAESDSAEISDDDESAVPVHCQSEMKKKVAHSLIAVEGDASGPDQLFDPERCSSSHRLFRITALVIKFIRHLRHRVSSRRSSSPDHDQPSISDLERARLYWIKQSQSGLQGDKRFPHWRQQLGLFLDEFGVWRCGGRMGNSCLTQSAQNPILLNKKYRLAKLVVMDAHKRVLHDGVPETLAELRSTYWLVQGRQFVRRLIHSCVTCRRYEGTHFQGRPSPPLPDFRVTPSRPFETTGVDFAGPFYVKSPDGSQTSKEWLCLYTCCSTRAVHLDLVQDMTSSTFLKSFRRFAARRGMPARIVSDNAKTFKSATAVLKTIIQTSEAKKFLAQLHIEWHFNLEKAPWWGGVFERMIKSAKRCLKKAIGRNSLTHDELLTLVVEVEAVLNSRPLTYLSSEDKNEPLTPSHLSIGYRVLTLPDPPPPDEDPDYDSSDSTEGLTRRMRHLTKALQKFWKRWKQEYLLELREHHPQKSEKL